MDDLASSGGCCCIQEDKLLLAVANSAGIVQNHVGGEGVAPPHPLPNNKNVLNRHCSYIVNKQQSS